MHSCIVMHIMLYCSGKAAANMKSVYVLMHDQKPNIEEIASVIADKLHKTGIRAAAEPWLYKRMENSGTQIFDADTPEGCEANNQQSGSNGKMLPKCRRE